MPRAWADEWENPIAPTTVSQTPAAKGWLVHEASLSMLEMLCRTYCMK